MTPSLVQIMAGVADNFVTNIHVGREFRMDGAVPRLGADVPRWYGETIGFWDKDALITWTSNIQGWTAHGAFEFSNKMQTIEIYTPIRDAKGKFAGAESRSGVLRSRGARRADPHRSQLREAGRLREGRPDRVHPLRADDLSGERRATPVTPGQVIEYEVPDMYGRPWAQIWEKYFEQGMERPKKDDEDIFKIP